MTQEKHISYYKDYRFHTSGDPEDRGEQFPDRKDRIKEKLETICITLSYESGLGDSKYLLFSQEKNALCYLKVNGLNLGYKDDYRRQVYIEMNPPSELPTKLSDLLEAEGFRKENLEKR